MSHEMRTPLNSIISLIKIIISKTRDPYILRNLKIIQSSAEMLKYLVCDMVDLFAIKNDRF